jgi:hypothetical protein
MGISYSVDPVNRAVRIVFQDEFPSVEEWGQALDAILAQPGYAPGFSFLVDPSPVDPQPEAVFVRGAVESLRRNSRQVENSRWAIVAPNAVTFGMARMGQMLSDGLPVVIAIFRDVAAAEDWLFAACTKA